MAGRMGLLVAGLVSCEVQSALNRNNVCPGLLGDLVPMAMDVGVQVLKKKKKEKFIMNEVRFGTQLRWTP